MSIVLPSDTKVKRRRRRKRKQRSEFDQIDGLSKVILSPLTQQLLGCVVGETVTGEDPWTFIDKEHFLDDLELREGSSEFLCIKSEIENFEAKQILIGYIPNGEFEYDEFYICLTSEVEDKVKGIINRLRTQHEAKMKSAISKTPNVWKSGGSEEDVACLQYHRHRNLYEVELETTYPIMFGKVHLKIKTAQEGRDGYVELLQKRDPIEVVDSRRIDAAVQAAPYWNNTSVQTSGALKKNQWTQYSYEYQVRRFINLFNI